MNQPPFEINNRILSLVAEITEKITRIETLIDKKRDLYLRKASKIKSVNSSCAIEANTLTEEEVRTVIDGKIVLAPEREIKEVKNAFFAYDNLSSYDPYNIKSFLEAHKHLTTGLIESSGRFRDGYVGVIDGEKVIHLGANAKFVPKLVKELFDWGNFSDINPLVKSCIMHYEIEVIHPFEDGNGRIGRLWQSLLLYEYNKVFEYIPIETLIRANQQKYYDMFVISEKEGSSTHFIEFILEMILKTIDKFDSTDILLKVKDVDKLSKTEKEVLRKLIVYFNKKDSIDVQSASEILNKNEANVRKYFRKLISLNILIPIGETKARKYQLNMKEVLGLTNMEEDILEKVKEHQDIEIEGKVYKKEEVLLLIRKLFE